MEDNLNQNPSQATNQSLSQSQPEVPQARAVVTGPESITKPGMEDNLNLSQNHPEALQDKAAPTGPESITKPGFVPDNPTGYAYMLIESPSVDARTGRRLSAPYPATFNEKDWLQFLQFRASQNLEVREILHLPAGWKQPEIFNFEN